MRIAQTTDRPSPAVAELIRAATTQLLLHPERLFEDVDGAVLATQPDATTSDPQVIAAIRAANRANLIHWGTANIRDPGAPVAPNLSAETLEVAREVVRRGLDDRWLDAYRVGENVAWRHWMQTAFDLDAPAELLREMLDVTARSIFTFVDETLAGLQQAMAQERAQLVSRTHAERLEIVNLILEHAPITSQRASIRLRYELSRRHTAVVLWTDGAGRHPGELEAAADLLSQATGAGGPLTVAPAPGALWAWFATAEPPDFDVIRRREEIPAGVRVAIGTTEAGIDGFRRSHQHALTTQRLMRRAPAELRLARYADVQLVALAAADEERAADFVTETLGALATADPVLRETVRVYAQQQFSATRAARALFTHRNTVLNRLGRAEELLAVPLSEHGLEVALALEILHWLGPTAAIALSTRREV